MTSPDWLLDGDGNNDDDDDDGDDYFEQSWGLTKHRKGVASIEDVVVVKDISTYVSGIQRVRQVAEERSVVPLFHYTNPSILDLIIKSGLRMSTQGECWLLLFHRVILF